MTSSASKSSISLPPAMSASTLFLSTPPPPPPRPFLPLPLPFILEESKQGCEGWYWRSPFEATKWPQGHRYQSQEGLKSPQKAKGHKIK